LLVGNCGRFYLNKWSVAPWLSDPIFWTRKEIAMGGFDVKASTLPNVTSALLHSAIEILGVLFADRGPGPWLDHLHDSICRRLKNESFEGCSADEEIERVEAALTAVDALFSTVSSKYSQKRTK
jgi:hypothetical protein